jgi:hypothetical protein
VCRGKSAPLFSGIAFSRRFFKGESIKISVGAVFSLQRSTGIRYSFLLGLSFHFGLFTVHFLISTMQQTQAVMLDKPVYKGHVERR